MSKEQLKEAGEWLYSMKCLLSVKTDEEDRAYTQKRIDLFNWLIEQAERVQELECLEMQARMEKHKYKKQNKRYREALEFYADGENYDEEMIGSTLISGSKVMYDEGQIAREVLEERSDR